MRGVRKIEFQHFKKWRYEMEIFVFKTNINNPNITPVLADRLTRVNGISRWSIDFGDRDKVLRVESHAAQPQEIVSAITSAGFRCEELD